MDTLEKFTFPTAKGIMLRIDPEDLPPGYLADCQNVDINQPYGVARVRAGSRSLSTLAQAANGGHPANPLGNSDFLMTARVLKFIEDNNARKLYAIVRSEAGKAKIYSADLTQTPPGFDTSSPPEIDIDTERIPSVALVDNALIIATGLTTAHANQIYLDGAAAAYDTVPDPERPPQPSATTASGPITTVGQFQYRACYYSSTLKAYSRFSDVRAVGPLTDNKVNLTVVGTTDADVGPWDRIRIFRTSDGGGQFRLLADIANPGSAANASYEDSTIDDSLGLQSLPTRYGRPPTSRFVVFHNDRVLYLFRSQNPVDPNVVYYSEPGAPLNVDPIFNRIEVRPGDGGEIVGAFVMYNRVYVLKSNGAVYELADNRPQSAYRVDPIIQPSPDQKASHACVSHATIRVVENVAFWMTRMGIVMFTGESLQLVSFPVEGAFVESQLTTRVLSGETPLPDDPEETEPPQIQVRFRNTDVVGKWFHFEMRAFSEIPDDPATATPVEEVSSKTAPAQVLFSGFEMPAEGRYLSPDYLETITFIPQNLTHGEIYYLYARASDDGSGAEDGFLDGNEFSEWVPINIDSEGAPRPYYFQPVVQSSYDLAWGQSERFFALDYWPTHELWVFVASRFSDLPDVRWVFDYEPLLSGGQAGEPPAWRRDLVHATAAILVDGLNVTAEQTNLAAPILGDANGCVFVDRWPGRMDRLVDGTDLTAAQQNNRVPDVIDTAYQFGPIVGQETDADGTYWVLRRRQPYDAATEMWPSPGGAGEQQGLRGMVVTLKTRRGPTDPIDTFTGLIESNTNTTLKIRWWFESRVPPLGPIVDFSINGIDAHIDYYPNPLGDSAEVKAIRQLYVRGIGRGQPLDVELRYGEQSEPVNWGSIERQLHEVMEVTCGNNDFRYPFTARVRFVGARFGTFRGGAKWQMASWGLRLRRSGARQ